MAKVASLPSSRRPPLASLDRFAVHKLALDATPNGVIVCHEAGTIVLINRQIETIFGYRKDELVGAGIELLLPEISRGMHAAERKRYGSNTNSRAIGACRELLGRRQDGSEVPVDVGLTAAMGDAGRLVIVSVMDVTERRQHQKKLEGEVAQLLAFGRKVTQVAARFVNVPAEEVDDAITDSLREIVLALDVDRSALWQFTEDSALHYTHLWTRPEFPEPPPRVSTDESFPWFLSQIAANRAIWIENLDEIPAAFDRNNLERLGIRASAVIPLTQDSRVVGAISFGALRHEMSWSPELRERMLLLAAVFVQALARKQNQEQLKNALADVERLRDQLALENVQLRNEVKTLRGPQMIAAESEATRAVLRQVETVARTNATVLLMGETGSGKEVFAQAIHAASDRHDRPMVRVNCATIPTALMESELFGRERGAYTGALSRQIGRFEVADGSTLFLDEIGELSLEAQVKFLHVLQDKMLERLGSSRSIKIDVRIIAATNRDLTQAVADRSFREDLFYRLNVFPIRVPPLRERVEDIPILVWTFVDEFSRTFNKKIESISREHLAKLQRYPWPGNVRELRNVIERAVIVANGPRLVVEPPQLGTIEPRGSRTLSAMEAEHIRSVLERVGWRVRGPGGAAQLLGLKPTTLDSRMTKLGIRRPER